MDDKEYYEQLNVQFQNVSRSASIDYYLSTLYQRFEPACLGKKKILELGSGVGTSKKYLSSKYIFRTDILTSDNPEVLGNVDAHNLPFEDESFDLIIGMDFFHHLQRPSIALKEFSRVLNVNASGFQVVLIEPYVSIFSYFPYKIFHREQTSFISKRTLKEPLVGSMAEDGDQTIPRLFFCTKFGIEKVHEVFPKSEYELLIDYLSILSFFITGGINRPFSTPIWIIRLLLNIERKIPRSFMKLTGSRMVIQVIKKV